MPSAERLSLRDQNGIDRHVASGERNDVPVISRWQDTAASRVIVMMKRRFIPVLYDPHEDKYFFRLIDLEAGYKKDRKAFNPSGHGFP